MIFRAGSSVFGELFQFARSEGSGVQCAGGKVGRDPSRSGSGRKRKRQTKAAKALSKTRSKRAIGVVRMPLPRTVRDLDRTCVHGMHCTTYGGVRTYWQAKVPKGGLGTCRGTHMRA